MEKKKKRFETPHTLVIIVCLIIIAAVATWFVPSGEFVRYEDPVSGETVVQAGSYTSEGTSPVSLSPGSGRHVSGHSGSGGRDRLPADHRRRL